MVLVLTTGAIDRGACIAALSQYPAEVEYLWVPCSYLEPAGRPWLELAPPAAGGGGGLVRLLPVRVNANLKAATVEELRGRKQAMLLASFDYSLAETDRELERIAREGDAQQRLQADPFREFDLQEIGRAHV